MKYWHGGKTFSVLGAVLLLGATSHVEATVLADWGLGVSVGSVYQDSGTIGAFGSREGASNDYDSFDAPIVVGPRVYVGTSKATGVDGWTGPTDFYRADYRSPLSVSDVSETWRLYVWGDPSLPSAAQFFQTTFGIANLRPVSDVLCLRLTVVQVPRGLTGVPLPGTVYEIPGVLALPLLPVYRTADPLEGYVFDLSATLVPEPASLLALTGGMGLLAGVLRRGKG